MDVLRTATSALSAYDPDAEDGSRDAVVRKSERLTSQIASIVATHERMRNGKEPVEPREDLSHAGNFLCMLTGEEPSEEATSAIDLDFILHAEHGANASSFAARVTASTLSDMHSADRQRHRHAQGPAARRRRRGVMKMALEIGEPERAPSTCGRARRTARAASWASATASTRSKTPARATCAPASKALSERMGHSKWYEILEAVVQEMARYQRHGIWVNVDFYAGSVYYLLGIPEDLFVPIFAIGRVPGWCISILEQLDNNLLIRPLLRYEGPMDLQYTPIEARYMKTDFVQAGSYLLQYFEHGEGDPIVLVHGYRSSGRVWALSRPRSARASAASRSATAAPATPTTARRRMITRSRSSPRASTRR